MIELEILHIDFDDWLDEFDSETNRFRDRYEKCQDCLEQTTKDYESMSNKLWSLSDQIYDRQLQVSEFSENPNLMYVQKKKRQWKVFKK